MYSIGSDDVISALGITFLLVVASVAIVAGLMWWLYRFFKNKDTSKQD
jgi:hypothetical protein